MSECVRSSQRVRPARPATGLTGMEPSERRANLPTLVRTEVLVSHPLFQWVNDVNSCGPVNVAPVVHARGSLGQCRPGKESGPGTIGGLAPFDPLSPPHARLIRQVAPSGTVGGMPIAAILAYVVQSLRTVQNAQFRNKSSLGPMAVQE